MNGLSSSPCPAREVFQRLGRSVARAWEQADRDDAAFTAIAANALAEAQLPESTSVGALVDWACGGQDLPEQGRRSFGQPPVTLFVGEGFFIEALFWLDGTTTVHQHRFAGAFTLLEGASVHSRFAFVESERVNAYLRLGTLRQMATELLGPGDVRRIDPGAASLHSVFHLGRPSVTIVVRTEVSVEAGPQLDVRPWGVAIDPRYAPEPLSTQLALLDTVAVVDPAAYLTRAIALLEASNRDGCYRILARAIRTTAGREHWSRLEGIAAGAHGALAARYARSLEEELRVEAIVARRRRVHDEDLRFFLALLATQPARRDIYAAVGLRYPERDPEGLVLAWIKALADQGVLGVQLDAISLEIARTMLRRLDPERRSAHLEALFPGENLENRRAEVSLAVDNLERDLLLGPLFATPNTLCVPASEVVR